MLIRREIQVAVRGRLDAQQPGPTLYLVFAGVHGDSRRGTGDLVAVSACHEEARQAFRALRLGLGTREGWAELTVVTDGSAPRRLSWFGVDRWPRPNPLTRLVHEPDDRPPRHRWRPARKVDFSAGR